MKEINVGDRFGQWLVTEVEERGYETSVLINDTKHAFGDFWVPAYLLQTLAPHHKRLVDIVRQLAEFEDQDFVDFQAINEVVIAAAALWKEYQKEGESHEAK